MTAGAIWKKYTVQLMRRVHPDLFAGDGVKKARNLQSIQNLSMISRDILDANSWGGGESLRSDDSLEISFHVRYGSQSLAVARFPARSQFRSHKEWSGACVSAFRDICTQAGVDITAWSLSSPPPSPDRAAARCNNDDSQLGVQFLKAITLENSTGSQSTSQDLRKLSIHDRMQMLASNRRLIFSDRLSSEEKARALVLLAGSRCIDILHSHDWKRWPILVSRDGFKVHRPFVVIPSQFMPAELERELKRLRYGVHHTTQ